MNKISADCDSERGVALLVTLFTLLLLTVIGLGMMVSTGTETIINANYRDKQTATFAAMSGLQEARDRIQPATLHILPPEGLPSLTAPNVVYIINPKNGESVAPWDPNNRYRDTELCQQGVLGLSGTPGIPCETLPGGISWYGVYNNSLGSAAPWQFSNPLDFKWVRITLKTNNMTPAPADGDGSNPSQVCWDGTHQILLPDGYGPECVRFGSVVRVDVTNPGHGYTSEPTVTIDPPPPGGQQALAVAHLEEVLDSHVDSVAVENGGSGYLTAPEVVFSGGDGIGASAIAEFVPPGAVIGGVTLNSPGIVCYSSPPAVAFEGGGGAGAAAAAVLAATNSCVQGWTVTGSCPNHKGDVITGVGLGGGGGSGFRGTLTFGPNNGEVTAISVQNPGNGYTGDPTSITNLSGCGSVTFTTNLGKRVQSVALTAGGAGYTSVPTVKFTTGTGSAAAQPTATASLGPEPPNAGQVTGVIVTSGGSGYTSPPTVGLVSDSGIDAAAAASLGSSYNKIGSITVSQQGFGYTTDPVVTITGGGGSAAEAMATLGRGSSYGKVYMITAYAETATGARTMIQMEAATPVTGFGLNGALVLDGPNPIIGEMPNSNEFYISGNDANSCGESERPPSPAIGAYDDPNADPPTESEDIIKAALPRPEHYTGDGDTPSVQNVYGGLGETLGTPTGLKAIVDAIRAGKTNPTNSPLLGVSTPPYPKNYIEGDLTLSGNATGYGILVVTGKLVLSGNFSWYGPVLVIGDGQLEFSGGGNGEIHGTVLVAKIWDNYTDQNLLQTLGSPAIDWNGGGTNGIYADHCWSENLMSQIPFDVPPSTRPLRVLSLRNLPY